MFAEYLVFWYGPIAGTRVVAGCLFLPAGVFHRITTSSLCLRVQLFLYALQAAAAWMDGCVPYVCCYVLGLFCDNTATCWQLLSFVMFGYCFRGMSCCLMLLLTSPLSLLLLGVLQEV
jgi:hypothetical protein